LSGPGQLTLGFGHRPALGRADVLVSASNAEAVEWIDRWPDWPAAALVLVGPPGSGKSHLGCVWQEKSAAKTVPGAALAVDGVAALLAESRSLVVEAAEAAPERALVHLYNYLREQGGSLLLTSETAPARWGIALPDLASRLLALPVATIAPPDDALMAALLAKLFADRQLKAEPDVVAYLMRRMERSFAAASDLVAAVDRAALARHRRITVSLVRDVLAELTP
jgi:chromosomal replication initiation ATPase DnaA